MRIILTGGGTAGHVTPNLALVPALKSAGFDILYVGSRNGPERGLAEGAGLNYRAVSTGKLRRYLTFNAVKSNAADLFRVVKGLGDASKIVREFKPDAVFSKGGFVSVPVVISAAMNKIPVVIHESDMTPGLANRLAYPFAKAVCATFEETVALLPKGKGVFTGAPIRAELLEGSAAEGLRLFGFGGSKPVLLVVGGSSGSKVINAAVEAALPELLKTFDVAHICGKNKGKDIDNALEQAGYRRFAYLNAEMKHALSAADAVISRAGSGSINELLALRKPHVLIPLSKRASRGDQILNAESFKKKGYSAVLTEEDLTAESLTAAISSVYKDRAIYKAAMSNAPSGGAIEKIVDIIRTYARRSY